MDAAPALWLPAKPAIIRPAPDELLRYAGDPVLAALPGMVMPPVVLSSPTGLEVSRVGENSFNGGSSGNYTPQEYAVNFGDAAADREIFLTIIAGFQGSPVLSSVTIGGVGATIHVNGKSAGATSYIAAIASAAVPTGTSGTVSLAFSDGGLRRSGVVAYRVTGRPAGAAVATYTNEDVSSSPTLTTSAGGLVLAVRHLASSSSGGDIVADGMTTYSTVIDGDAGDHFSGVAIAAGASLDIAFVASSASTRISAAASFA